MFETAMAVTISVVSAWMFFNLVCVLIACMPEHEDVMCGSSERRAAVGGLVTSSVDRRRGQ